VTSKAVLATSGALGFVVVAFGFPDWQVAVETAQVTAGIVEYPQGNPFYIYHLKLWTILHQVCALMLLAGVSEITASIVIGGVLGMVTFQALAMVVYALSRDAVLAITSVVVIVVSNTANIGVTYPIALLGTSHTYGMLGLSLVVLVGALLGAGEYGPGLFLLGLAPAVHPSLGIWLALIVAICFVLDLRTTRGVVLASWRSFAAGCAVSAVSLAVHLAMSRGIPPVAADVSARYLTAFTSFWDGHRQPVPLDAMGVRLNFGALALAVVALVMSRAKGLALSGIEGPATFLMRFVAVTAAIAIGFIFVSWLPPDRLPLPLVILMPTRLLNVDAMLCSALVVGLLGTLHATWWGRWSTLALAVVLVAGRRSMLWEFLAQRGMEVPHPRIDSVGALVVAAIFFVAASILLRRQTSAPRPAFATASAGRAVNTARVLLAAIVIWIAAGPARETDEHNTIFRDRTNDLLLGSVAWGKGLLLTGGDLHLVQLRTRRPVLLDGGGLDGLAYSLPAAPALDRILKEVYGVDLFNPPEEARNSGTVPPAFNRDVWQRYGVDRWRAIKAEYNVRQVLVPSDWALALPIAAQSRRYLLYDIP
jgi:hypothetical protein